MKTRNLGVVLTWGLLGLALALLWLVSGPAASAAPTGVLTVCPAGPPGCDYSIIQDAVDAAIAGDVVKVATGTYSGVQRYPIPPGYPSYPSPPPGGVVTQVVYISKTITLRGGYTAPGFSDPPDPDANPTTLDAQGQGRVFLIGGNISPTIEGVRITNGDAAGLYGHPWGEHQGGGVYVLSATVTISDSQLFGNSADRGGGLFLIYGKVVLTGSDVTSNTVEHFGGGLSIWHGDGTLYNNTITANGGTGLNMAWSNTTLSGNTITDSGGYGVLLASSSATLSGNTISHNGAGGVTIDGSDVTLLGNTISSHSGYYGGGVYVTDSTTTFTDNRVVSNTVVYYGGGIYLEDSTATFNGNSILSNTSTDANGGGLYLSNSDAQIIGNTISGNKAYGYGGGMYWHLGNATISENIFSYNTAWGGNDYASGGGLSLGECHGVLNGNLILSNTARYGGGLHLALTDVTLDGNTISSNVAITNGGGLRLQFRSNVTLTNNIIADNQAGVAGSGMCIHDSSPHLLHTTIARNGGGDGSGIAIINDGPIRGTVYLSNTILVSHTVGIAVATGNTATLEATLWGDGAWANGTDWAGAGTILTGTVNVWGDPAFVDPDASDYHIGPGSAAIDAGVDAGVNTDIDGEPRPQGGGYDIGADELFAGPRLAVTKQASASAVQPGEQLTYTLRVSNTGTVSLTATITDILPPRVTPGGVLTWTPPPILPSDTWTETVAVTVDGSYTGLLANIVQVRTEEGASGTYTNSVFVEEAIAGLQAVNDSPTLQTQPTMLTATVAAGSAVTYTWAFGDGEAGSGAVVSHVYPAAGPYTAIVIASNHISELTATTTVTITPRTCWVHLNDDPADYLTVQAAVDASTQPTDVVKVAGYCPGVSARSGITQSVYLSKTLTIQGGYTTTDWIVPDPVANPAVLDAQGQGRVIYISGNISPTIEGLRTTGGDATGLGGGPSYPWNAGGGIYVLNAALVLSGTQVVSNSGAYGGGLYLNQSTAILHNNVITDNLAHSLSNGYGGGIYSRSSDVTLTDNVIANNVVRSDEDGSAVGGGLLQVYGNLVFNHNTVVGNWADDSGGGMLLDHCDASLDGNVISGNRGRWGGGVYWNKNTLVFNNNTITNNRASYGGGLYLVGQWSVDAQITRNTIRDNTASRNGGGMYFSQLISLDDVLVNNIITDNDADYGGGLYVIDCSFPSKGNVVSANTAEFIGGGLYLYGSDITLTNDVVTDNQAGSAGSGLDVDYSSPWLRHCTIARNSGGDGSAINIAGGAPDYSLVSLENTILMSHAVGITVTMGNTATLQATLWGDGAWANGTDWAGEGTILTGTVNVWGDPAFVDPDAGDYHIGPGSAAIDAGVDAGVNTDIDGEPRPIGAGYDIGADEFPAVLSVAKQASDDPVETGSPLTYTLYVTNTGVVSLTATITDVLPPHVTPGGSLTWNPGLLAPGETWSETAVLTVEMGYIGPLTNVVRVATEEGASGVFTNTVTVVDAAIAGLAVTNSSPTVLGSATTLTATVAAGSNITYTWAFGDGVPGSGATVVHIYPEAKVYTAVVTASNSASQLTATTTVTITEPGFYVYLPLVLRATP